MLSTAPCSPSTKTLGPCGERRSCSCLRRRPLRYTLGVPAAPAAAEDAPTAQTLHYVVPPGQEAHIEALFAPYVGGAEHQGARVEGISLHQDRIELRLKGADGGGGSLVFRHRSKKAEGDEILPSFAATMPGDAGADVEALARALVAAARGRDKGDFPWRAIEAPPPKPPEPERGPWLLSWLGGTGWALLLWLGLAALFGVWALRERAWGRLPP